MNKDRYFRVTAPGGFDGVPERRDYYLQTQRAALEFKLRIKRWKAEQKAPTESLNFDDSDLRWLGYLRAELGNLELLPEVLSYWKRTAQALTHPMTVAELIERFTFYRKERKPALGRDALSEGRFVTDRLLLALGAELLAHEVTPAMLRKFLNNASGDWTRRKYFKITRLLFKFAVTERAMVINPLEEIEKPQVGYVAPDILTPDQFASRLRMADQKFPELLPYLAIGGFAGVRRVELVKEYADDQILQWSDILWDKNLIEIRAEVAKDTNRKAGDRRFVPLEPALVHWLEPYKKEAGPVVARSDSWLRKQYQKMCVELGQKTKDNELRSSFASYYLARDTKEGFGRLARIMGNSEEVCRKHYVESLSPGEGEVWFSIRRKESKPRKARGASLDRSKVVPFRPSQFPGTVSHTVSAND